jgi:ABC-type nitrate/sulfonate/bicarbonate transport system permease component
VSTIPADVTEQEPSSLGPVKRPSTRWPSPLARTLRWTLGPALLIAWQLAAMNISALLIPTPIAVVQALWKITLSGELLEAFWLSNQALLIGTTSAIVLGIPFGVLLGRSKVANRILGIYIDLDLATPSVALLPLIIMIFGLGLEARSIVVFTFSFPLIVAMVRSGSRTVDPRIIEMGQSFAPTTAQLWRKVLLPGMLPTLAGAMRVGVSRGVVGMIIVELTLVTVGLGGMIMEAQSLFRSDILFAGVLVVCLEGVVLIYLANLLEKKIAPQGLYATEGTSR